MARDGLLLSQLQSTLPLQVKQEQLAPPLPVKQEASQIGMPVLESVLVFGRFQKAPHKQSLPNLSGSGSEIYKILKDDLTIERYAHRCKRRCWS